MSDYQWTPKKQKAVMALAEGYTIKEASEVANVSTRTIDRWKCDIDFMRELDRLSMMINIASPAHRLRIAMKYIRKLDTKDRTSKDILEWLRYAQGETTGVKLDLTDIIAAISEAGASVAGSESAGTEAESDQEQDDTD